MLIKKKMNSPHFSSNTERLLCKKTPLSFRRRRLTACCERSFHGKIPAPKINQNKIPQLTHKQTLKIIKWQNKLPQRQRSHPSKRLAKRSLELGSQHTFPPPISVPQKDSRKFFIFFKKSEKTRKYP